MIPQLRIRTEFSFRDCYGSVQEVFARLEAIGCQAAGIVDTSGTWGHVSWEKYCGGVLPMYGSEFTLPQEGTWRPRYWALAEDQAAFYRFSSIAAPGASELASRRGFVVFAGAALTDPDLFDAIDINPRSMRSARRAMELARRTGKPIVLTSDNDYPAPEHRERFLAWTDNKKMTPQHILSDDEMRAAFSWMDDATFKTAVRNTNAIAERCSGIKLARAPIISVSGDIHALCAAGKEMRLARGHIAEWTAAYEERLQRELRMIAEKQFESYFVVVADMITWAKERMLVGPARGSSAGSLVCYLMRITEVDPLKHDLLFERFIDINRNDLPDIDIDFNDQKREQVFEYLAERYGKDNVARIGSINRLKPRSVIAHVGKALVIPASVTFPVVNVLLEYSSGDSRYGKSLEDTLTTTQPGRAFIAQHPEAALMAELEEHASHSGVHAAGVIVSNVPVTDFCTVRDGVAQIDKKEAEYLGLLKIDALGLRTLGVIEETGLMTPQQLYDLQLDDPAVLEIFNERKFSGVFQFEGAAQRRVSIQIPVKHFEQIDHITALARPGPLGGGATNDYINRNSGIQKVTYRHPTMAEYLQKTMGVVLYQEQVMRISREIGGFSWQDVSIIRRAMSGRKGKEFFDRYGEQFVAGAANVGLSEEDAKVIWETICTFGAWGMNKSHTVSYSIISYWCAYMKRYHPLEYAAACLRNAKDDNQTIEILRELVSEGIEYIPFDIDLSERDWVVRDGKLIGGFQNLHGIGPAKSTYYIERRAAGKLTDADRKKLLNCRMKNADLRPAHSLWGHIYADPISHNINGCVREFAELEDGEDAVVIAKLERLERRDENETVRLARRGGVRREGQTLFVDAFVVDDSISKPIVLRIRPRQWLSCGELLADRAVPGQDWFLIRGRWLNQFSMMIVEKIKCLTNPEMFNR